MTIEKSREIAGRILDTTRCDEEPAGTWGPREADVAQTICREAAESEVENGRIDADEAHIADLAEALYREIFDEARALGARVVC